jgi:hypothetical protein
VWIYATKAGLRYLPVTSDRDFKVTQKFICNKDRTTLEVWENLKAAFDVYLPTFELIRNPGPPDVEMEEEDTGEDQGSSSGEFPDSESEVEEVRRPDNPVYRSSNSAFSPVSTASSVSGDRQWAKKSMPPVVTHSGKKGPSMSKSSKKTQRNGDSDMVAARGPKGSSKYTGQVVYGGTGRGKIILPGPTEGERDSDADYDPDEDPDQTECDESASGSGKLKGKLSRADMVKAKDKRRQDLIVSQEYERTRQAELTDQAKLDSIGNFDLLFLNNGASIDLEPRKLTRARKTWCTRDFDIRHCALLEKSFLDNTQRYMFQIVCVYIDETKERHEITEDDILSEGGPYEVIAGSHTFIACQNLAEQYAGHSQNYWETVPVRFLVNPTMEEIISVGFRHNRATATKLELSAEDLLLYFRRVFKDPLKYGCESADGMGVKEGPLKRKYEQWRDVCLKTWYVGTGADLKTVRCLK